MVQGKATLEPVQWIIIRLAGMMPIEDVCMYTDLSKHTVKKILAHFWQTGGVEVPASRAKHHLHRAYLTMMLRLAVVIQIAFLSNLT